MILLVLFSINKMWVWEWVWVWMCVHAILLLYVSVSFLFFTLICIIAKWFFHIHLHHVQISHRNFISSIFIIIIIKIMVCASKCVCIVAACTFECGYSSSAVNIIKLVPVLYFVCKQNMLYILHYTVHTGVIRIRLCFLSIYLFHVNPQFTLICVWLILIISTIRMFELIAWYEISWTVNMFSTLLTNNPWNYMDWEYVLYIFLIFFPCQRNISIRSLKSEHVWVNFFSQWSGQALNLKRYKTSFDLSGKFNLLLLIYKRLRTGSLRNLHVGQSSWVWTVRTHRHTAYTVYDEATDIFNEEDYRAACNELYIVPLPLAD